MSVKWRTLWLLSAAELLAMGLWFSASAVVPQLVGEWGISPGAAVAARRSSVCRRPLAATDVASSMYGAKTWDTSSRRS